MSQDLVARALMSLRNRDFIAARHCIAVFAQDNPLELQHYLIQGLSEIALKDWSAASATFAEATGIFPHQPHLWFNLGVAQENLGLLEDAAASFEHSLDIKPDQGDACGNLSNVYRRLGLFINAEKMAHRAYELGAPKAAALNCLGLALARQGQTEAAEKIFRQILELEPANAHALVNLANCAIDRLDFPTAWPFYAAARAADNNPIIRHDEGLARLLAGDYAAGWALFEARLEKASALRVRPPAPLWRSEPLAGKKLLLIAEQGYGDTIQFCRYGLFLVSQGAMLSWVVPKPLLKLLADNLPGEVLAESDPLPATDYYLPLLSLPLMLQRLSPSDAPEAPYLRVAATPELPGAKKGKRKIGLVWAGSPTHERAEERSIPLEQFAPLWTQIPALYYAAFAGDSLKEITSAIPVRALDKLMTDFAATAGLLTQLDCLVTVDTAAAHLAGALGIKTFLLLPYCPDWRWGISGTTTPFYPSLTLIRQSTPGDWQSAIDKLTALMKAND